MRRSRREALEALQFEHIMREVRAECERQLSTSAVAHALRSQDVRISKLEAAAKPKPRPRKKVV